MGVCRVWVCVRVYVCYLSFLPLSPDIVECDTGRHSCANDTVRFNVDGGYDCD